MINFENNKKFQLDFWNWYHLKKDKEIFLSLFMSIFSFTKCMSIDELLEDKMIFIDCYIICGGDLIIKIMENGTPGLSLTQYLPELFKRNSLNFSGIIHMTAFPK